MAREGPIRKAGRRLLLAGVSLLLLYPFIDSADRSEVFVDEVAFISAGHAAVTRVLHGDFLGPDWMSLEWSDYGWPNPMLGKMLLGSAIYVTGHGGREYGTWKNKLPGANAEEVRAARWIGILFGWGACLLLLVIGSRISTATGIVASLYAAYNADFVWSCSLAMLEAPLMFFMVLTLLTVLRLKDRLYDSTSMSDIWRAAVAVGIAAGCATSAKLFGGAVLLFASLFVAGLAASRFLRFAVVPSQRRAIAALMIVSLVAPAVFYVLNPQFYPHPIERVRQTLAHWKRGMAPENHPTDGIFTRGRSFAIVTHSMLSGIPTSKRLFRPLFYAVGNRWPGEKNRFEATYVDGKGSVEALLMAFAVATIALSRWRRGRLAPLSDQETHLFFMLFIWGVMIGWLPVVQGRYFLFPFIATPPIVAIGLCELGGTLASAPRRLWGILRPGSQQLAS